jgi:hypothetical protein
MRIFIALLIGVLIISCRDDILAPNRPCEDSGVPVGSGAQVKRQTYEFSGACFNPNNPDEIAYLRRDNSDDERTLYEVWKHSLQTNESTQLHKVARPDQWLKWSTKNWILFLGNDGQVWKVNAEGTQASNMTAFNTQHNFPDWHPNGDSFVVGTERPPYNDPFNDFKLYIFSAYNGSYRPFDDDFRADRSRLSPSGNYIVGEGVTPQVTQLITYAKNLETQEIIFDDSLDTEFITYSWGHAWFPDERRVLWCTSEKLYVIDLISKDFTVLKEFCDLGSRRYRYADVSSDGKKILITREDHKRLGGKNSGRYYVATNIVIMNADGTGEEVVDLGGE